MEALENVFAIKECVTPLYRLGRSHEKRVPDASGQGLVHVLVEPD